MNPLIGLMAKQANSTNPVFNMLEQFNQFKNKWTPQSAQAKVSEMLETGQITRQQYEQAKQMADQFKGLIR